LKWVRGLSNSPPPPSRQTIVAASSHLETSFADQFYRWRDQKNVFRTTWNVNNVPALVKYERVDGVTKEVGRLIEGEILDGGKLAGLVEA
jgi:hypothetical protein